MVQQKLALCASKPEQALQQSLSQQCDRAFAKSDQRHTLRIWLVPLSVHCQKLRLGSRVLLGLAIRVIFLLADLHKHAGAWKHHPVFDDVAHLASTDSRMF